MFEAIWSALDFWQRFGVIVLTLNIPIGIVLFIDDRGGWIYIDDLKRKFKGWMK